MVLIEVGLCYTAVRGQEVQFIFYASRSSVHILCLDIQKKEFQFEITALFFLPFPVIFSLVIFKLCLFLIKFM